MRERFGSRPSSFPRLHGVQGLDVAMAVPVSTLDVLFCPAREASLALASVRFAKAIGYRCDVSACSS